MAADQPLLLCGAIILSERSVPLCTKLLYLSICKTVVIPFTNLQLYHFFLKTNYAFPSKIHIIVKYFSHVCHTYTNLRQSI
jgi:hypothetical protein